MDPNSIYQTFCDIREFILSGKVDHSPEKAIELSFYDLAANFGDKLNANN